jgi:hypothetical protein
VCARDGRARVSPGYGDGLFVFWGLYARNHDSSRLQQYRPNPAVVAPDQPSSGSVTRDGLVVANRSQGRGNYPSPS